MELIFVEHLKRLAPMRHLTDMTYSKKMGKP